MAKRKATLLRKLSINEISLVDHPASPGARVTLYKRKEPVMADKNDDVTLEGLAASLEKAEADNAALKAEVEKLRAKVAKAAEGKLDPYEGLDAAVATELRKRDELVAKQQEQIEKLKDATELGEYVAKAAGFKHLPVKAEVFAPILRKVAKALTTEEAAELDRVLKAADVAGHDAARAKEIGSAGTGTGNSAEAELVAKAKAMAEQKAIPFAKAYNAVLTDNPDLYTRYMAEKGQSH